MVRLFGHHIALPVALLVLCELCLFLFSLVLALWIYPTFAHSSFQSRADRWIVGSQPGGDKPRLLVCCWPLQA